jgi:lysophospholipase L1-like esterase
MPYRVIGVLGDSIADGYWDEEGLGWFGRLRMKIAKAYPYKFGFNNQAVSGDRCTDVLNRLRSEIISREVDILLIAVGVNDGIRWDTREYPMAISEGMQFEVWQNILATAKKNINRVVVCSPIPVDENKMPFTGAMDRKIWFLNKDIEAYNQRLAQWCSEAGILFIDLYSKWQKLNVADHLYDGAHPNAKGHEAIADQVFEKLKKNGIL